MIALLVGSVLAAGLLAGPPGSEGEPDTPAPAELRDYPAAPVVADRERGRAVPRLLSAAPNVTEICCALGLGEALVGRTRYCAYPPRVKSVPEIGGLTDASAERLIRLRPELILVSGESRAITEKLQRLGLKFVSVPDRTIRDVFTAIRVVGEVAGREASAKDLVRLLQRDLEHVTRAQKDQQKRRVLVVLGTLKDPPAPPFVFGPGSFYDDLLKMAGHENVVEESRLSFAPLSLEAILKADPDVIIELDADGTARPGGATEARKVWANVGPLSAVREDRVAVLTGREFFLTGPRIARVYAALCSAINREERGADD